MANISNLQVPYITFDGLSVNLQKNKKNKTSLLLVYD